MSGLIGRVALLARSPQGRRMARQVVRYAQSPEGREQLRRAVDTARSPETRARIVEARARLSRRRPPQ